MKKKGVADLGALLLILFSIVTSVYLVRDGLERTEAAKPIEIDNTTPLISFEQQTLPNNAYKNQNVIYINWTYIEQNLANITVWIYNYSYSPYTDINLVKGMAFTTPAYEFSFTPNNLNTFYFYNITIIDQAGNKNATETRKITLDNIAPTIDYMVGTESNNSLTNKSSITINVIIEEINFANITYYLLPCVFLVINKTIYTNNVNTITFFNLNDEQYYFNVTVTDLANNKNNTILRKVTINTTCVITPSAV